MEKLKKVIQFIYNISLIIFMGLGAIIVITQLFSVITSNGSLSVNVYDTLQPWALRFSVLAAFASFIMTYFKKDKTDEDS